MKILIWLADVLFTLATETKPLIAFSTTLALVLIITFAVMRFVAWQRSIAPPQIVRLEGITGCEETWVQLADLARHLILDVKGLWETIHQKYGKDGYILVAFEMDEHTFVGGLSKDGKDMWSKPLHETGEKFLDALPHVYITSKSAQMVIETK